MTLYNAANKALGRCVPESQSSRATDVNMNGKCLNQYNHAP